MAPRPTSRDTIMSSYPAIQSLELADLKKLEHDQLGELLGDVLYTMTLGAESGMFDGTLELVDAHVVGSLREALLNREGGEHTGRQALSLLDDLEDVDLQHFASVLFTRCAELGDDGWVGMDGIDPGICTSLAVTIEEWQSRYLSEEELRHS